MLGGQRWMSRTRGQPEHRKDSRRLGLIGGESGTQLNQPGPESIPLISFHLDGVDGEGRGPNLDRDPRMRFEVVVPVRIGFRPALGRGDDHVVAVGQIGERIDALGARTRAEVVDENHRRTLEVATDLTAVSAELLNDLAIPATRLGHGHLSREVFVLWPNLPGQEPPTLPTDSRQSTNADRIDNPPASG